MRTITSETIIKEVKRLCLEASCQLPKDVLDAISAKEKTEKSVPGKSILGEMMKNASIASTENLPLCQDTGVVVIFVELGTEVKIEGGLIYEALTEGVRQGYKDHYLRKSLVKDPLFNRVNTGDNTPPIMHVELVPGDKITIHLAPKGGGSENMSQQRMLKPYQGKEGVVDFVLETVIKSGGNACPPLVVGVGIGGNLEHSCFLAKKSLLRKVGSKNPDPNYAQFEAELLEKINATGLGPSGLGGTTTAIAVHVLSHPCHIASLPVAVNLNCNSARHASVTI